jgi:ribonucleoside-diphosphate reductase alpha chain
VLGLLHQLRRRHDGVILDLAKTEGMLFKYGSGTGSTSPPSAPPRRTSRRRHRLRPGQLHAGFDAFAGVIKSGGKTRRAAKMVILNADHPDIEEFIDCKVNEEKKAWALIDAGYDGGFNGEAYARSSSRTPTTPCASPTSSCTRSLEDGDWRPRGHRPAPVETTGPRPDAQDRRGHLVCGDPGHAVRHHHQRWHTCPNTGRINASNPCSEYMFLDDSACNLASLNLMKFVGRGRRVRRRGLPHAVRIFIIAQEIIVDNASYPTERSPRTATTSARSAWATPTSARC